MNNCVNKINSLNARNIINFRSPIGLFYVLEKGLYIGIDNSTGHAWTEEFNYLRHCKKWLCDISLERSNFPPIQRIS